MVQKPSFLLYGSMAFVPLTNAMKKFLEKRMGDILFLILLVMFVLCCIASCSSATSVFFTITLLLGAVVLFIITTVKKPDDITYRFILYAISVVAFVLGYASALEHILI